MEDNIKNTLETIVAHDYVLIKGVDHLADGARKCAIQIPIEEARILFNELLKEDYLQESHSSKYGTSKDTEYTIRSNGWRKSKKI